MPKYPGNDPSVQPRYTAEQLNAWSLKKMLEKNAAGINTNVGAKRAKGSSKHAFLPCDEGGHWPAAPFIKRCECGTTYCGRHPHECETPSSSESENN